MLIPIIPISILQIRIMFIDDDEYEGGVDRHDCCAHVPIITCNWPPWDTSEGQHSKNGTAQYV